MEIRNGGVYGGSPLDRLNSARADAAFVRSAFASDAATFLLVDGRTSRVHVQLGGGPGTAGSASLMWLRAEEVPAVPGGLDLTDVDAAVDPRVVLLGAAATSSSPSSLYSSPSARAAAPVAPAPLAGDSPGGGLPARMRFAVRVAVPRLSAPGPEPDARGFLPLRSVSALLAADDAAVAAHAVSLLKFHERHAFCGMCGAATVPDQGGGRRRCSRGTDAAAPDPGVLGGPQARTRFSSGGRGGGRGGGRASDDAVQEANTLTRAMRTCAGVWFPRIDPVAIMLVVDSSGTRCLLGRAKRFPPGMWSCLAGFMEHGERVEDTVRREVMEEAGVEVCASRMRFYGSQPWPEPYSLMLGCVVQSERGGECIAADDRELEDARWFGADEVAAMASRSLVLFASSSSPPTSPPPPPPTALPPQAPSSSSSLLSSPPSDVSLSRVRFTTTTTTTTTTATTTATATTTPTVDRLDGVSGSEPFIPPMTSIAGQMLAAFAKRDPITIFSAPRL